MKVATNILKSKLLVCENLDNSKVVLSCGSTISLTEYIKDLSNDLISKLEKHSDDYSLELKQVLKNCLGQKWSKVINEIDKINSNESLILRYNLSINAVLSEILYP